MRLQVLVFALVTGLLASAAAQTNDNFAGRLTLSGAKATAISNNLSATRETGEPDHAANAAGRSLWWTWTAPASGVVNFSTFSGSRGVTLPRVLAVYTGGSLTSLTEAGSSNDLGYPYYEAFPQTTSLEATGTSFNLPVTAGTTYQIAVDADAYFFGVDDGTVVLSINAPPTIVAAASVNATTGTSFQYSILATNNPTVYGAMNLPPGLSLNPTTGVLSGVFTADGTYAIGLAATGPGGTGTATLTLQVGDPAPVPAVAPAIEGEAGASGYVGASFSYYFEATGSPTGYTAANLPAGLVLDATNGDITGTPTAAGTFSVPLTATNAIGTSSATVTIAIAALPLPPIFDNSLAASGTVGVAFSYYLATTSEGPSATVTGYTATGLPPGLGLDTSNSISGTPTQAGVYPVAVSATNAGGTRTATVTISVSAPAAPAPVNSAPQLDSSAAATAAVGTAFSYTLAATNAPASFGASNLPSGLSINTGTGAITGTPTVAGTFLVPVSATNGYGTSTATLTINVFASVNALTAANGSLQPVITSPISAGGYTGQSLYYPLEATYDGTPSYYYSPEGTWSFSATGLPPGLILSSPSSYYGFASLGGTPTTAGTYQTTISATYTSAVYYPVMPPATTAAVVTFVIKAGPVVVAPTFTGSASVAAVVGNSLTDYPSVTNSPTGYSASGLPPGLSISASTGYITGTPTTPGTYPVALSATNSVGTGSATVSYIVTPQPVPLVTSYDLASAAVGTAFTYTITTTPAATNYGATNLPPGLSCNAATGAISGTPTAAGVYTVPLAVTNSVGTGNATLTITVGTTAAESTVPTIGGDAAVQGTVGSSIYYYFDASGSPTSYATGTLPPGLTLDATYGEIEGTPTTAGIYTVPISASNAAGTGQATLKILVSPLPAPSLSGSPVVNATVNSSFYYYVSASNSPTSYAASGLPAGVTLNTSTGYLSGTITAAGSYPVTISVTNASGMSSATLTLNITPVPAPALPVIISAAGATGVAGSPFSYAVQASGTPTSYAATGVPAGLTFNTSTGVLTGTPTTAGTYPLTVSATNVTGIGLAVVRLVVAASASGPPVVTSAAGVVGLLKEPFNYFLTTNSPTTNYTAGNIPTGLSLNSTTGQISGTPTQAAAFTMPISATNAAGTTQVTLTFPVINPSFAVFTSPAAISAVVGQSFTTTLTSSSTSVYSSAASPLPPGLTLNASTGVISGSPTTVGSYPATITQSGSAGTASGRLLFTVFSATPKVPVISSPAGMGAFVGVPFTYVVQATNAPTSFAAPGLPAGLTLNTSTGLISGTPSSTGTFTFGLTASNSQGTSGTATVTMFVSTLTSAAPVLSAASVAGVLGAPLNYTVTTNTSSFYSLYASNLPPGLSLNSNTGLISGTPGTVGTYYTTLNVTNSYDASSSTVVTFRIAASASDVPTLTSPAGASGIVGTAFSYTVSANNAATTLGASNLPTGLSFNAATGVISGTPAVSGTYSIPLTATNSVGQGSATLTLVVAATSPVAPTLSTSNSLTATYTIGSYGGQEIYATGNPTSYAATNLPPGLSVSTSTGLISGTLTAAGIYPVTISATNAAGTASAVSTYVVTPVTVVPAFTNLAAEAVGFTGISFGTTYLEAAGSPTSYAVTGLPPGLSLNSTNGTITGSPMTAGTYAVTVSATNAAGTGSAVWTVLVYNSTALQPAFYAVNAGIAAAVGQPFSYEFEVIAETGGISATVPLTFSYNGLPPGISGNASDDYDAYLSGTPTAAGSYPVTITATSPAGVSTSQVVTLVISSAPPAVTSAAGVPGNVGSSLSYTLTSASTISAYAASGLPPGLTFNASTGTIAGTPTTTGTYAVPVSVTGIAGTGSAVVTFQIATPAFGGLPVITSAAATSCQDIAASGYYYFPTYYGNPTGAFSYTITATNLPTSFGATNLPAGLSLNPYTGVVSGQPLTSGVFQVPISATNAVGTVNATLTIIATATLPTILNGLTLNGSVGFPFTDEVYTPNTEGESFYFGPEYGANPDPLTFTAAGLPPGLSLNTSTGFVTGTPTQAGVYPVTLSATNRAGTGSAVVTVTITSTAPAVAVLPAFVSSNMAAGFVGFPLNYSLSASYATSYTAAGLPAGLSFNPTTGTFTGTPTQAGTFSVPVSASNAVGTVQAVLTVAVDSTPPAPYLFGAAAASATIGTPFAYAIAASSTGSPAITAYVASNLPAGLSLNSSDGLITGTPTGPAGTFLIPISASIGTATGGGTLTLTIQSAAATTTQPALATPVGALGFVANPLTYALGSTGFAPTSTLPAGLSFDPTANAITGYPTTPGIYQITLAAPGASNSSGAAARKSKQRHPTNAGRRITGTMGSGSTAVLTLNVISPDLSLPVLTNQPLGTMVSQNGTVTFSAAAIGVPSPGYQWSHNGVPLSGASAATFTLSQVQPADAGNYTVTAANTAGQAVSAPAVLTVHQTYATWQAAHFSAAEIAAGMAADEYDYDGDGLANLLKYALDIDPKTGTGGSPPTVAFSAANGALQLMFTRDTARADINYVVEASPDLVQWTPIASSTAGTATLKLGGALTVGENVINGTSQMNVVVVAGQSVGVSDKQFMRLRIVGP